MHFLAVIDHPGQITGRKLRVQKTVKSRDRSSAFRTKNVFNTDNPLAIRVQFECLGDARSRSISSDDVLHKYALSAAASFNFQVIAPQRHSQPDESGSRLPNGPSPDSLVQIMLIERTHSSHP